LHRAHLPTLLTAQSPTNATPKPLAFHPFGQKPVPVTLSKPHARQFQGAAKAATGFLFFIVYFFVFADTPSALGVGR
jgi:hypothetical protein